MSVMPNREALKNVREQRGLNVADVAAYTAISPGRLDEFEQGERAPSRKQMEKLADTYGVPLYSLFGSSIPNLPPLPIDFRKSDPRPALLSPRGMHTLLASERISYFSKQLADELKYTPAKSLDLPGIARGTAETLAKRTRGAFREWWTPRADSLGFTGTVEQQFIGAFRLFFEVQGGILNINDAPADDYMGFFITPEGGLPTIFVNRAISSKKAQLFTLIHEYAHAKIGRAGISNPFTTQNDIEQFCNKFAVEFLAPINEFSKIVETASSENRATVEKFVNFISSRSLLSRHAAAIRLLESDYITRSDFSSWRKRFVVNPRLEKDDEKEAATASGGGVPHAKRISELGHLPVFLANQAVTKKIIDGYDVEAGLGLSRTLQDKAFALAARRFAVAQS